MTRRDPMVRVRHMLDHAREALQMSEGRSRSDLDSDRQLNLSLVHLLEIVGEAAGQVTVEFREEHPEIPWRRIVGLRNRLIHAYDAVDLDVLWTVMHDDSPPLVASLEAIVAGEE